MKKTLSFETIIQAPRARVWERMLAADSYKAWTAVFNEGSRYEGSWELGARIRFVGPSGDGMSAVIAENRLHEFMSIRHEGMIENGVEDLSSDKVRAWAPAYENYRFETVPEGCKLTVSLDCAPDWEQYMVDTYPRALAVLKQLCET
ncbi:SRPBCC domain-containing protein [Pelomonas sp. V22]|uniref:SRPBCC family protein n=1 Tax=Pelomonas sp. V22 TaxID=2822139 RepID=UPI0024A88216|nr:SRPBCC domain-containing protein [Pelomonas sp. V22]MDI4632899.1 SRPBCC domain-containing protein [Pelomonas sp. V22]